MLNTGWPEKTEIRGLRLKVQPVDDAPDIPDGLIPNLVLTTEGFREQLLILDEYFPEDVVETESPPVYRNDFL